MIVALYEQDGDWNAYRTSLQVYIDETAYHNTNEPTILLVVPNPIGDPFNKDAAYLKPNEGFLVTDTSTYRPE
jgi:hypothetical protein